LKKKPELSVVILCYRAEEHIVPFIRQTYDELSNAKIDFELILVANFDADGRVDETPVIAGEIAKKMPRCVCVAEPKKGRMGWDLRQGLARASGNYIAFLDGDGQTLTSDILKLYDHMRENNGDFCKIYRTERGDPPIRKLISRIYNLLFRFYFPTVHIRDINAKPKIMTRSVYERLKLTSNDWFADAEIVLEAHRLHIHINEISGVTLENTWRKSFIGIPAIAEFLKNMFKYRIKYWFSRR
jgi:glycosyltransferase involved in cell wall biosynthesis